MKNEEILWVLALFGLSAVLDSIVVRPVVCAVYTVVKMKRGDGWGVVAMMAEN